MWVITGSASVKPMMPHQHGLWWALQVKYC